MRVVRIEGNTHIRRILDALSSGAELDARRASVVGHCTVRTANRYFETLRARRMVHVTAWERRHHTPVPVYAHGAGRDVLPPPPLSSAAKQKRYRDRHRVPSLRLRSPLERAMVRLASATQQQEISHEERA